jgi:hypothetical protein
MIFIDALPKNEDGQIITPYAGLNNQTGEYVGGTMNPTFLTTHFAEIANATLPLAQKHYEAYKAIDPMWAMNIITWRKTGVVEIYNIPAEQIIEEEEALFPQPIEEQLTEEA